MGQRSRLFGTKQTRFVDRDASLARVWISVKFMLRPPCFPDAGRLYRGRWSEHQRKAIVVSSRTEIQKCTGRARARDRVDTFSRFHDFRLCRSITEIVDDHLRNGPKPNRLSATHRIAWASIPTATGQGSMFNGVEKKMLYEATATPAAITSCHNGTIRPGGSTGREAPAALSSNLLTKFG
jgi:hypothetical protein